MDKAYLQKIVLDQQQRMVDFSLGYERERLSAPDNFAKLKINIVVTGPRRSGKSTFLLQWMNKYYKNKFYYFDFSDDRLIDFDTLDFQQLYEIFLELYGERNTFFFDEIQGKPNWNKFVNRLYESGKRFFITGSNAELLSKEISTYLTGRHLDIIIYPFSFKEFAGYYKFNEDIRTTMGKTTAKKLFIKYLDIGGFPEVVVYDTKNILSGIYNDILNKDILVRYSIGDEYIFKKIALYLISNIGNEYSYTALKNNFNLGSTHTAKNYVSYLCNTYILFELTKYDYSLKKQESASKKIYCIDQGLVNVFAFAFSENKGRLYENIVYIELLRRNKTIYYWKDKYNRETDFIILDKNKVVELIQVCFNPYDVKTKNREVVALQSAMDNFKLSEGIILTDDYEAQEKMQNGKTIKYIPLWKWLLMK